MQAKSEYGYNSKIEGDVVLTTVDAALAWFRKNSVWPMPMGLACCAIELMAVGASRFDISRFGSEVMRFSPRQSDCMIVAGTVTYKMAGVLKRVYDQMPEPKWVIAMGACASTGGMYRSYAVLQGVDNIVPVDVYIGGCPPRPEAVLDALIKIQEKIGKQPILQGTVAAAQPAAEGPRLGCCPALKSSGKINLCPLSNTPIKSKPDSATSSLSQRSFVEKLR